MTDEERRRRLAGTVEERFADLAVGLLRFRVRLAGMAFDRDGFAGLEELLANGFDPLVRAVLAEAGGPRAALLEAALDLAELKNRLTRAARDLPRSPDEDAMLEGDLPPDLFTEIRTTVAAVGGDQLDLAIDNLLVAAGYRQPGDPPPSP